MDGQMSLFELLAQHAQSESAPLHMPGHKRNAGGIDFLEALGAKYDITEIEGFDDLHDPRGVLKEAMERAARLWKSESCFFLVNGSTGGILAAVRAAAGVCGTGRLIMARGSHRSVYNAAQLCGLEPVYLSAPEVPGFGFSGSIAPAAVAAALGESPGSPVIITSPGYEGIISNIAEIALLCHMHGSPLIVDEAHGAHLDLSPDFPLGAVRAGADIVVQSVHKTLTGLTQAGLLHLGGGIIAEEDIRRELTVFQTSSPSYPIMASIDGTVRLIESRGRELFGAWSRRLERFERATESLQKLRLPGHDELIDARGGPKAAGYRRLGHFGDSVYAFDRSKIIISCEGTDTTGAALMDTLRTRYGIECEMASGGYLVAMSGLLDKDEYLERLSKALVELDGELKKTAPRRPRTTPPLPQRRMEAARALSLPSRLIYLRDAQGAVAAEYVWAYPPGIPLLVPGEEISRALLTSLLQQREEGIALKSSSGAMPLRIRVLGK